MPDDTACVRTIREVAREHDRQEATMRDEAPGSDGQHDAHVHVLSAEVRTLVVGSRQVTLSVYSQLDNVNPADIEPFGRVNPKDAKSWAVQVVGRDKTDGALARAWTLTGDSIRHLEEHGHLADHLGPFTPSIWRDGDAGELKHLAEEWEALPLIVLAGLR